MKCRHMTCHCCDDDDAAATIAALKAEVERLTADLARHQRALAAGPAALRIRGDLTGRKAAHVCALAQKRAMEVKTTHANRCPHCRRYFSTPQGLGMHFAWMRRIGSKRCRP